MGVVRRTVCVEISQEQGKGAWESRLVWARGEVDGAALQTNVLVSEERDGKGAGTHQLYPGQLHLEARELAAHDGFLDWPPVALVLEGDVAVRIAVPDLFGPVYAHIQLHRARLDIHGHGRNGAERLVITAM